MSVLVKTKIKLQDREAVIEALENLKFEIQENNSASHKEPDIIAIKKEVNIGLNFNKEGQLEIIADWSGQTIKQNDFINQLKQQYALIKVKEEIEKLYGYKIENPESLTVDKEGTITIKVVANY